MNRETTLRWSVADDAFISTVADVGDLLDRLRAWHEGHFDADPENITWDDVRNARRLRDLLRTALGDE